MLQPSFAVPVIKNAPGPISVTPSYSRNPDQSLSSPGTPQNPTLKRRVPSLGNLPAASQISMIEPPTPGLGPTNALNKIPTTSSSLYHTCRTVLDRLAGVPGFSFYLEMESIPVINPLSPTSYETPPTPGLTTLGSDPTTRLWQICRFGSSLCALFNALGLQKQLDVKPDSNPAETGEQKRIVYKFIHACKNELHIPDEELFTLTDLYGADTNGFVKVVRTVSKVLSLLEEAGILKALSNPNRNSDPNAPKDTRDKVVQELLETERKHVHDMEQLQNYQKELHSQVIIPANTVHKLFANLNALVDFQRRFLISLEAIADQPPADQRFGHLFITSEDSFQVYEPFCANYREAVKLVMQEVPNLMKLSSILEPTYVLPSMLIKPVQRICKYPLLLQELIKSTKKDCPSYEHMAELEEGLASIKRVADSVNETQRKQENGLVVEELKKRVVDWKNHNLSSFGNLLLEDKFLMSMHEMERELHVFLFEKNLLICKEVKESSKSSSKLNKTGSIKKRSSLQVRGLMFIKSIIQVKNESANGLWSLRVYWKDAEMEWFGLRCRNEEQLKLWNSTLTKLMNEAKNTVQVKRTQVSNTMLASLANMPSSSFIRDQDDDDNDDDNDEDDEEDWYPGRTKPPSHYEARNTTSAAPRPRMPTQDGYHRAHSAIVYPTKKSFSNGAPPLPRTSSTSTMVTATSSISTDHGYNGYANYPHSPPSSGPSSPISSARISTSSSGTASSVRQRRSGGENSPLAETIQKYMLSPEDASPGEEHQSYMTANQPYPSRSQPHTVVNYAQASSSLPRSRSQSSPNIHHPHGHRTHPSWDPDLSVHPSYHHHQQEKYIRHAPSNPQLAATLAAQAAASQMQAPGSPGSMTLRLNYLEGQYSIIVPLEVDYQELVARIDRKIRLCANVDGTLRIKYQDEDGDLIVIESDDDVTMAFELAVDGLAILHVS